MATKNKTRAVIAIVGATSRIGDLLLKKITKTADVIALSSNITGRKNSKYVRWRSCDLFSLTETEKGLEGADYVIHFVHSVNPSATLTQAAFQDIDALFADNVARAAKKNNVKQIFHLHIFASKQKISCSYYSKNLMEVENILSAYGVPVTTIQSNITDRPEQVPHPAFAKELPSPPNVRSIQRVKLPEGTSADWAAEHYPSWLATMMQPFLISESKTNRDCNIRFVSLKVPLLTLTYTADSKDTAQAMYFITGGILVHGNAAKYGRMEFRQLPDSQDCIIAIHDYRPALPWLFYKYTQANIHLLVMHLYKKHLFRLPNKIL